MRRTFKICLVQLFLFLIAINVQPTEYYYYGDSGQILLPVSTSMVSVKAYPAFQDWSTITLAFDALVDTIPPAKGVFGYDIYFLEVGTDVGELLDTLNNHSSIREALPLFQDSLGFILLPNDQFVLKWSNSISENSIDSIESLYAINMRSETASGLRVYEITDSSSYNSIQIANLLFESGQTVYSHPDFASKILDFEPNDPYFQFQYYFDNTQFPVIDLDAKKAWEISKGDTGVIVAVLDEGIQSFHEDLDSSKFIFGYDFVGLTYIKPDAGPDNDPSPDPINSFGHGMCVAGIISGEINNEKGISGLAPKCKLMRLKIYGDGGDTGPIQDTLSDWGLPSVCAMAIEHAYLNGAKVINGSWGWNYPFTFSSITNVIELAYFDGSVLVFSSGNNSLNRIKYPASLSNSYGTIAVGAIQKNGTTWPYSNYGTGLTVVAPSGGNFPDGDFYSLDIVGAGGYNNLLLSCQSTTLDYMCEFGGTSAAAPQVSAIAALIFSRKPDYKTMGQAGSALVRQIIWKSAVDQVGSPSIDSLGWDSKYGYGLANAFRALLAVARGDVNNSGSITILDLTYYIDWMFRGGPAAIPDSRMGDNNCDGSAPNAIDLTHLVNYLFRGGPAPSNPPCYAY